MKVRAVIRVVEAHGFRLARQRGSHRRFVGVIDGQTCYVTIAGKESDELSKATLSSIRRQSGLPGELFR